MRRTLSQTLWYVLVSAVLVLGACVKPVNIELFLEDEKVQKIINGKNITIDIEVPIEDWPPEVAISYFSELGQTIPFENGSTIPLQGGNSWLEFVLTNPEIYDIDTIRWVYKEQETEGIAFSLDISVIGTHIVTVKAARDGIPYSTSITFAVVFEAVIEHEED